MLSGLGDGWKLYELVDGVDVYIRFDERERIALHPLVEPSSMWTYSSYGYVPGIGPPLAKAQAASTSIPKSESCDSVDKWNTTFESLSGREMLLSEFEQLLGGQIGRDAVWFPYVILHGVKAYELLDGTQVLARFEVVGLNKYRVIGTPRASCVADWHYSGRGLLAREPV
jgi:hypothetical protein